MITSVSQLRHYRSPTACPIDVRAFGRGDDEARLRFANLLKDAELTPAEVSRRAGLERRTAARWLHGPHEISSAKLAALLAAVGGAIVVPPDARHLRLERLGSR